MMRTKIIATVGPASDSEEMLGKLADAGVDVFRLNFSHGTHEQHTLAMQRIRRACRDRGATTAVMVDLCGPKIRVDLIQNDRFEIVPGDVLEIVGGTVLGNAQRVSTNRAELINEVEVGHRLLIDDGNVRLRVQQTQPDRLVCVCEVGGGISSRKGINLPDSDLAVASLTDKDRQDVAWAIEHQADFIAMSFVRSAQDLRDLEAVMRSCGSTCPMIAKIETPQAVDHLDEIIEVTDAVLVARGDLGVEMDLAQVPLLQKDIVARCQRVGKPVIVATQMLQSMVHSPVATRAEVSDVANAILDATDCIMLSAETSVGTFPLASVDMATRIAAYTERFQGEHGLFGQVDPEATVRRVATTVARGASLLARELNTKLVAVWTQTGETARLLSKCRLDRPVIGLTEDEPIAQRMALYYGVLPLQMPRRLNQDQMVATVDEELLRRDLVAHGDLIIVVAGTRVEAAGATGALLIHRVGSDA